MASNQHDDLPAWARHVAPNFLIAGVVVSFLGCCLAGWLASRHDPFKHFERFHPLMNPESLYYPTAGQVRQLARDRLDPAKIAVVVAGDSRMHGSGQPVSAVWTHRLKTELGDDFDVINLGFRNGATFEFGEPVAEMLLQDHRRVILVTDCPMDGGISAPDGRVFRYFYWDAFYKGMLLPAPARNAALKEQARVEDGQDQTAGRLTSGYRELRSRMGLDSRFYFTDLWAWIGYRYAFTLWTIHSQHPFTKPRWSFYDHDAGPLPLDQRFRTPYIPGDMKILTATIDGTPLPEDEPASFMDPSHPTKWGGVRQALRCSFPDAMREHIVLVVPAYSRYHRNLLGPAQQAKGRRICEATVRAAESEGLAALEVGEDFSEEDYTDFLHLSPSGGEKIAIPIASIVRKRARALGYIP